MSKYLAEAPSITFHDLHTEQVDILPDILKGLRQTPKTISPKFFYDERGSKLFEQITRQQEYYPTRTECAIFSQYGEQMATLAGSGSVLLELGSGSSSKIRLLLDALEPHAYVSADISKDFLLSSSEALKEAYPDLDVQAVCLDYTQSWSLPMSFDDHRILAFFPGSTIGNFEPLDALAFLKKVRNVVGPNGALLIGVDLIKDKAVLDAAYNDAAGVTAAFNLNVLTHLNHLVDADFDESGFEHVAFYNRSAQRIEMHLEALSDQSFNLAGERFQLRRGERILTEYSHKYSPEGFLKLAAQAGFEPCHHWTDERNYFGVFLLN